MVKLLKRKGKKNIEENLPLGFAENSLIWFVAGFHESHPFFHQFHSGQMEEYFTNLDFLWNEGIWLPKSYLLGAQVVWGRYD